MRIESIRLHPFGGTRDKTISFATGANILEGPNEAGKSTLCAALYHALFTPTDLTPAKFKKVMGRWLPRPSGDHARVTLVFNWQDITHTLIRTWGAKAGSELVLAGQAPLGDAKGVQDRIRQALQWNEATWENVLFINQAKLNTTLETLQEADSIEEVLRKTGALDGDIAPEKMIAALEARIEDLYSNWDRQFSRPRDGRGVTNPHKRNVGPVLKAYYASEELQHQYDEVVQHEHDLDQVNAGIGKVRGVMDEQKSFVEDGRKRKDGLHRRSLLEQSIAHRQAEILRLMKVLVDWPGAEQILKDKQDQLTRSAQDMEKMKTEIDNAKLHEGSDTVRRGYEALAQARKAVSDVRTEIAALKPVLKEDIDALRKLGNVIEKISVEIKAQKLAATLEATERTTIQVKRGAGDQENIELSPGAPFACNAEGRISITAGNLTISVRSDQKDVEQLYADLERAQGQHAKKLKELEVPDLAALEARKLAYDATHQRSENASATYTACLRTRTEEEWEAAMEKLKGIPATRALKELEEEQRRILKDQARFEQEAKALTKNVTEWTKAHVTVDQLMAHVMESKTVGKGEETELATLPTLPEGFSNTDGYLKDLARAGSSFDQAKEALTQLLLKQSNLQGRTFENTAEELKERLELAGKEFLRQLNEAKAFERILARVRSLGERTGPDPFAAFQHRVAHFVELLTDGRYKPQLDGIKATGMIGAHELENALLSQGTQGCLALAIRMAYAEIYLGKSEGFMIMDDPLTDMDPGRRKCAVSAIKGFAQKYQVIILTCHPEHAEIFLEEGAQHQHLPLTKGAAEPVA